MAEDGRPSERGHPGKGCFIGLVLLPLVLLGRLTRLGFNVLKGQR